MNQQEVLIRYGQERETSDDYYTLPQVFDALGLTFDLDVCAPPGGVPWIPAARYFTKEDDGLSQAWTGRVWMNPPYSNATPWVQRFIAHGNGVALVGHAKSAWHSTLWEAADGVAFPRHYRVDWSGGEVRMPVWFAAFGAECVDALARIGIVRTRLCPPIREARAVSAGFVSGISALIYLSGVIAFFVWVIWWETKGEGSRLP